MSCTDSASRKVPTIFTSQARQLGDVGGFLSAFFILLHLRASGGIPDDPGILPSKATGSADQINSSMITLYQKEQKQKLTPRSEVESESQLLLLFQIIDRFDKSRQINFNIYLNIVFT